MKRRKPAHPRGQALVEVALMLPILLLTISMLFWTVRNAVILERMQTALRYQGEVADQGNAATYLTFNDIYYAAYALPDPAVQASLPCSGPAADILANTGSANLNGLTIERSAFWLVSDAVATCTNTHLGYGGSGLTRDALVQAQTETLHLAGNTFTQTLGSFVPMLQPPEDTQMTFFRQPSLYDSIVCFPDIANALKATLIGAENPATDSTAKFVATEGNWSIAPPSVPLPMSSKCRSSMPANFVAPAVGPAPPVGGGLQGSPVRGNGNLLPSGGASQGGNLIGGSGPAYM